MLLPFIFLYKVNGPCIEYSNVVGYNNTAECIAYTKSSIFFIHTFFDILRMCINTRASASLVKNECICGRCSQMCRETLFSWRPLLSLCCGLLVGFISVQDDIIVQAERRKYCIKTLQEIHPLHACTSAGDIATKYHKAQDQMWQILQSFYFWFGFSSMWLYLALPDIWTCDHYVVYLFAEAEHGYASMPPFISSRERESLKRKSKSKKNTSSR